MGKPLSVDYAPSNPPTDFKHWHRWIVDELRRIAAKFNANPVLFALSQEDQPVDISPVYTLTPLGIGAIPFIDNPGGDYDTLTGIWTCPLKGVYMITAAVVVEPFGTGNKAYQADVIYYRNGVERGRGVDSAVDDVPLSVNLNSPALLNSGDEIRLDLGTIHAQFTGSTLYDYNFSAVRLGSAQ